MNALSQLLSSSWIQAIGWTLLHSLWQGLVCFTLVALALRSIPSKYSGLRYKISTAGLLLLFIASVVTFFQVQPASSTTTLTESVFSEPLQFIRISVDTISLSSLLQMLTGMLQASLPFIVVAWIIGAFAFSLRVLGGYWYVNNIRTNAIPLNNSWAVRVQTLASALGVGQFVSLAESPLVQAPVVIGYLKPVILMPVGLISGLSTDQVESILIHELIHIRRGDYIVNIIQSLLESLFFFNPFVWIISSFIRREREHCCDDTVIKIQGKPLAYVHALATLEEARLARTALTVSFADNKNHLLHRIKRIMEKSVQNYSGREKVVPLLLLIVGLMCASWLTIQSRDKKNNVSDDGLQIASLTSDTTKKKKNSVYYKRSKTVVDENGDTQTTITEESDSDDTSFNIHFTDEIDVIPPVADIDLPEVPEPPDMDLNIPMLPIDAIIDVNFFSEPPSLAELPTPMIPPFPPMYFNLEHDTIPGEWHKQKSWDEFNNEFEKNFKEKFEDFYNKHEEEMNKMFEELKERFDDEESHASMRRNAEELAERHAKFAEKQRGPFREIVDEADVQAMKHQDAFRKQDDLARVNQQKVSRNMEEGVVWEKQHEYHMKKMEADMKELEKRMKDYEVQLKDQLVKDGYLGANEKMSTINITDGTIEVNGKKVKEEDMQKYRSLRRKLDKPAPGRRE